MRYPVARFAAQRRVAQGSAWRHGVAAALCAAAAGALIAGCGESPNPPIAIVQNYLNALGGGEFASACAMADPQALARLARAKHAHMGCAQLLRHCLPNRALVSKKDQTQLLYANIDVSLSDNGKVANADTSATPVATELKHVTLQHEHGVWKFTGFGHAIEACRSSARPHERKHRSAATHRPRHKH